MPSVLPLSTLYEIGVFIQVRYQGEAIAANSTLVYTRYDFQEYQHTVLVQCAEFGWQRSFTSLRQAFDRLYINCYGVAPPLVQA